MFVSWSLEDIFRSLRNSFLLLPILAFYTLQQESSIKREKYSTKSNLVPVCLYSLRDSLGIIAGWKEWKEIFEHFSKILWCLLARRNNKILGFYKLCVPSFVCVCVCVCVCGMFCFPLGQESSHNFYTTGW